jgi:molybdenum cofactor biosynthesis enzyme
METLTAVHIALLTIYDMWIGVDSGTGKRCVKLLEKSGTSANET